MFIITVNQEEQQRKIATFNYLGIEAFMKMNVSREEYHEVANWVADSITQGYPVAGWTWANGDSFEIYCPENESLPTSVTVANPLRKLAHSLVSAIL